MEQDIYWASQKKKKDVLLKQQDKQQFGMCVGAVWRFGGIGRLQLKLGFHSGDPEVALKKWKTSDAVLALIYVSFLKSESSWSE